MRRLGDRKKIFMLLLIVSLFTTISLLISLFLQNISDLQESVSQLEMRLANENRDPNYELLKSIGILHSNISEENYPIMDQALKKFDPKLQRYLAIIPFISGDARTAIARTRNYEPPLNVYSIVSYDWDNTYKQSQHWESSYRPRGEDPDASIFSLSFKLGLFVHEYLHHAELKRNVNIQNFFHDVQDWYDDPSWGKPSPDENYQKYLLYWHIYREGTQYSGDPNIVPGREEFAYIGETIATGNKKYLKELPPSIIAYYERILRPNILQYK